MGTKPATATIAWWVVFPFLVGGGAFALGGIGAGIFGFAASGLGVAIAVRFDTRLRAQVSDLPSAQAGEARVEQFRWLWLIALAAVLAGVATALLGGGATAGAVAAACLVAVGVGGGVALVVMRHRGGQP